jgi:hypothetical protein
MRRAGFFDQAVWRPFSVRARFDIACKLRMALVLSCTRDVDDDSNLCTRSVTMVRLSRFHYLFVRDQSRRTG